jgi:hypothetical protein
MTLYEEIQELVKGEFDVDDHEVILMSFMILKNLVDAMRNNKSRQAN